MTHFSKNNIALSGLILLLMMIGQQSAFSQTAELTYQGQLRLSGEPFTGTTGLEFRLFDQMSGGSQIGSAQARPDWPVEDGLFQVELDFGSSAFDGSERFLEVRVNGAPLTPRQQVTATPYALLAAGIVAGVVDSGAVDPTEVQLRVVGTCPAGQYVRIVNQDGSVTCGTDEVGITGWRLTGNTGIRPDSFLGTTDAIPLELRTQNARSLRLEPSAEQFDGLPITVNVIAGSHANEVAAGIRGATIAGGGVPDGESDPNYFSEAPNRVNGHYSTVSGGYGNTAGGPSVFTNREFATVSGGSSNTASGSNSTVGGGSSNDASFAHSTVGGGFSNVASGIQSLVGGGSNNLASGLNSAIGGGELNTASKQYDSVGGGSNNVASGQYSTVGGGEDNTASGRYSTVGGGFANCAGGWYSWAGGHQAKVRSGVFSGVAGTGCDGAVIDPELDDLFGDQGTFVWADDQPTAFVSTGDRQFLVRAEGGVGLGTNEPSAQLHVIDAVNGSPNLLTSHVAVIENNSIWTHDSPDVLALKTSAVAPTDTTNFITFFNGNDQVLGSIHGDNMNVLTLESGGADFAEWLPKRSVDEIIEPGDVIGWHEDGISHDTRGALRVMTVSTRQIVAGNAPPADERDDWAPIGFIGQVPVNVIGPVAAGEWIIPSGREDGTGVAVSAGTLAAGQIARVIGQALESANREDQHQVNVAIGLGLDSALGDAVIALQSKNAALQEETSTLREHSADLRQRLAEVESRQDDEMKTLRAELAMLRELIAPQVAAGAQ